MTFSVLCTVCLFLMSLTISCVTHGRSALLLICLVGMCRVDNLLTSALNMSQRWFGSLCLCAMNVLVKLVTGTVYTFFYEAIVPRHFLLQIKMKLRDIS